MRPRPRGKPKKSSKRDAAVREFLQSGQSHAQIGKFTLSKMSDSRGNTILQVTKKGIFGSKTEIIDPAGKSI